MSNRYLTFLIKYPTDPALVRFGLMCLQNELLYVARRHEIDRTVQETI